MNFTFDWGLIRELAVGAIFVAGLLGALGVLAKSKLVGKPLRWLWRRNISDPLGGWAQLQVRAVVDDRVGYLMTHKNGGSSLKDLADGQKASKEEIVKLADQHKVLGEKLEVVELGVATLLEHDRERDQEGKRYGEKVEVIINEGGHP